MNFLEYIGTTSIQVFSVIAICWALMKRYIEGYLNKKGEQLATKEDFTELLEQTKKLTSETAKINSALAEQSWIRQQNWAMKEQRYSVLLSNLEILRQSLQEQLNYYDVPGSQHNDNIQRDVNFRKLAKQSSVAFGDVKMAIGPSSIFLPDFINNDLDKLVAETHSLEYTTVGPVEPLELILKLVSQLYENVLCQAKKELQSDS